MFALQKTNIATLILNLAFSAVATTRFTIVLISLRKSLKRQRDVRQNVEEIINFSEFIEDNPKKYDSIPGHKVKKYTPAISFVDDVMAKNKKDLHLAKEENKEIDNKKE